MDLIYRDLQTNQTYTVPVKNNTGVGSYTCLVNVSSIKSPESESFDLTASGI